MKVLIVGYGNMGREVEKILTARGHEIAGRIDPKDPEADAEGLTTELLGAADAAIEFSLAGAVFNNARSYVENGVAAVVGTTGWEDSREEIRTLVDAGKGSLLWGSNFSVGAHIFFSLANKAAAIIDGIGEYDIMAYELHHSRKKDSPSGTALKLGEGILANCSRKKRIVTDRLDRKIDPEELHIASVRGGSIPGIHTVVLDSSADSIEITHSARNRSGFALGAVLAAEWLEDKTGFFRIEDFIQELITT
jgi:4-hydroxy-tetrahydrodipicolinate reductase